MKAAYEILRAAGERALLTEVRDALHALIRYAERQAQHDKAESLRRALAGVNEAIGEGEP